MKNKRLIILLILLVVAVAIFFVDKYWNKILPIKLNADKIETVEIFYDNPIVIESKQLKYDEKSKKSLIMDDYLEYISANMTLNNGKAFEDIPVYELKEIILENSGCSLGLGRDAGLHINSPNVRRDYTRTIFTVFPTTAIRESENNDYIYAVYDTDSSIRVFLYFSKEKNNYNTLDGFPIIMSKSLCYEDFADIRIGDKSSSVESIDLITKEYVRFFDIYPEDMLKMYTEKGAGPTSVHLLKDGILKIEYKRIESGEYEIIDIVYREDFILSGLDGDTCYKIAECDYPSEKYERSSIILNSKDNVEAIAEIAAIFNESIKHPEQGIGTTHPTSVTIKYNNGKKTSFSCGVGNFITVARGKRQYNYINGELDEYIAQIISDWKKK